MTETQLEREFEHVSVNDLELIQHYLCLSQYEESNHNIVNMFVWMDWYPLFMCQTDNWLLLLGVHEGQLFIYMPLCLPEYFAEALTEARRIFNHYGVPFVMSCFTEEGMERVKAIDPTLVASSFRDSADYVYRVESLMTFSGKKLQKKRNHLNAFYKEYEGRWAYESLTMENLPECQAFLDQWKVEDQDAFMCHERSGIKRIFAIWDRLPAKGGLIRIDGEVKAFAIGSALTRRMCQENIEKADDEIRGIYQAIVKELLTREFSEYEYVNREDDLGLENIRQAKLAYHPEFLIDKYRICGKGRE